MLHKKTRVVYSFNGVTWEKKKVSYNMDMTEIKVIKIKCTNYEKYNGHRRELYGNNTR